jgi:hypothetical protein
MTAPGLKVLIVNPDGLYLAGTANRWEFTDDRSRARVFDYDNDRVGDMIHLVRKVHELVWIAVRLDPHEAYEFCDRCGRPTLPANTFFDGRRFLCRDCWPSELNSAAPSVTLPL